jgi:group I intron endonuclease
MKNKYRVDSEVIPGVYAIINKVNGHMYIGSSFDIYGRWSKHQQDLAKEIHHSDYFQKAWNKYKKQNFDFVILERVEGDIKDRFRVEQKWVDYYLEQGVVLYNMNKNVVTPIRYTTAEDLKIGKRNITWEQFELLCYYLSETKIPLLDLSDLTGIHPHTVYEIYERVSYTNLTKDIIFIERTKKPIKLSEDDVMMIIDRMMKMDYDADIAKDFNISVNTIKDIRCHRIWKHLTEEVVFPDVSKRKRSKGKPVLQYDLDGNFIAEYSSAREAEKTTGIGYKMISRVCLGERPHTHGFIFKFKTQQND